MHARNLMNKKKFLLTKTLDSMHVDMTHVDIAHVDMSHVDIWERIKSDDISFSNLCRHSHPPLFPPSSCRLRSTQFFPPKILQILGNNIVDPTMPPKMMFAKRSSKESARKRRTKAQDDAPGSSSDPSSSIITPAYANKVIARGRCLTIDFLEREGFSFGSQLWNLGL